MAASNWFTQHPPPAGYLPTTGTFSPGGGPIGTTPPSGDWRNFYTKEYPQPGSLTVPTSPGATPFPTTPATTSPAATTLPATTSGGGNLSQRLPGETTEQWVVRAANSIGRSDIANDPGAVSYWASAINSKPQSSDMSYWLTKIQTPDTGGAGEAGGFGAFTAPFTGSYTPPVSNFQAPVGTDDPGFQFAVQQGQDAIQRSAAAKGNLLTGGTLKDLASYTTGAALQDYAGSYNRALSTAGFNNNTAFQAFGQNYDIFRNNQNDPFQKLYQTTGLGLNAAGQANSALGGYGANLSDLANQYARSNTDLTTALGGARATGTQVGSAQNQKFYQDLGTFLSNWRYV